jgi:hypothetical protein
MSGKGMAAPRSPPKPKLKFANPPPASGARGLAAGHASIPIQPSTPRHEVRRRTIGGGAVGGGAVGGKESVCMGVPAHSLRPNTTPLHMGSLRTASSMILGKRLEAEMEKRQQALGLQAACDEMEACAAESRRALKDAMAQRRKAPETISISQIAELEAELKSAEADAAVARGNVARYRVLDASVNKYLMTQQEGQLPRALMHRRALAGPKLNPSTEAAVRPPTSRMGKKSGASASRSSRRASTGRKARQPGRSGAEKEFETRRHAEASKRERLRRAALQRARPSEALMNTLPRTLHDSATGVVGTVAMGQGQVARLMDEVLARNHRPGVRTPAVREAWVVGVPPAGGSTGAAAGAGTATGSGFHPREVTLSC